MKNSLGKPEITIRKGIKSDLPVIHQLIVELAIFEREPNAVSNTIERMEREGFGNQPAFEFFVAEVENKVVGLSLYYYRYSTWKGRCLYLEDLIVTEEMRGLGIGKLLFDRTVQHGKDQKCSRMNWQVLDWNTDAIRFYERYHADFDGGWLNGSIEL